MTYVCQGEDDQARAFRHRGLSATGYYRFSRCYCSPCTIAACSPTYLPYLPTHPLIFLSGAGHRGPGFFGDRRSTMTLEKSDRGKYLTAERNVREL